MKLKYSVVNEKRGITSHCEINLVGYYNTQEVIDDFQRVIDYHELRYQKYKAEYIKSWGQDLWDKNILGLVKDE